MPPRPSAELCNPLGERRRLHKLARRFRLARSPSREPFALGGHRFAKRTIGFGFGSQDCLGEQQRLRDPALGRNFNELVLTGLGELGEAPAFGDATVREPSKVCLLAYRLFLLSESSSRATECVAC